MSKKFKKTLIIMTVVMVVIFGGSYFLNRDKLPSFDYKDVDLVQLNAPKTGQEIAIIDTTLGTFKVALYREYAPNTVENFVKLAKTGYYDGKYVFSAVKDSYFLAGTTNKSGVIVKKGEANYDQEMTKITNEIHKNLLPLKGSLISFGPNLKDSGTFFSGINTVVFTDKLKNKLKSQKNANQDIINAFIEKGGMPYFTGNYTVFAQTYEGLDVFEKVCNVAVDSKTKAPKEEIKINKITISTYGSN